MTDADLKALNSESDITDDLNNHFKAWGRWEWSEIADEALRVHNVMFDEAVESDSAFNAITTAAVAHAQCMAYEAMAAALGVNASHLRITIAEWSEYQHNLPPPVSAERLMEMIGETKQELEDRQSMRIAGTNQTHG